MESLECQSCFLLESDLSGDESNNEDENNDENCLVNPSDDPKSEQVDGKPIRQLLLIDI